MNVFSESILLQISTVVVLIILSIFLYCKRCFAYWNQRGVHTSKPLFIFGNAKELILQKKGVGSVFKEIYDEGKSISEDVSGFYFFTRPCLVPIDLDLIKAIMKTDFAHFTDRIFHNHESDPLSEHLGSLKGSKWKNLRVKLSPAFTSAKTKMILPNITKHFNELLHVIDEFTYHKKAVPVHDVLDRFTIDTIGSCAFGVECNSLSNPNSEFRYYATNFFSSTVKDSIVRLLTMVWPEVLSKVKVRSIRKDISEFFLKTISENIKYREEYNVIRQDLLHLLIQIRNNVDVSEKENGDIKSAEKSKVCLSETNVAAQALVFFMAGYETSSITITFCLYELAVNAHLQELARQDIDQVLAKHDGEFTYDAITEMTYIEKCLKETLRKYPPSPVHMRECTSPYKMPGETLILEKGTPVFVPVLGIHKDPNIYPNPEEFDPERFSEENMAKRHPCSWIPFGFGPRMCIATKFAMTEIKATMAKLLKNYRFSTNDATEIPIKLHPRTFVTHAVNGVWLTIEKLN